MTKEEKKQYMKEYYENNKEKMKEYKNKYRENNKEKIKEKRRKYYENNKEVLNKKHIKYYENNKESLINERMAQLAETSYAPKHREFWTEDEIIRIINPKMALKELAKEMGRSEQAINHKRMKLKKLGYKVYKFKK